MPWDKGTGWSVSSTHGCGHSHPLRVATREVRTPRCIPLSLSTGPSGASTLRRLFSWKVSGLGLQTRSTLKPGEGCLEIVPRGFGWNMPVSATEEGAYLLQVGWKTKKGIHHTPLIGEKCRINAKRHRPGRQKLVFDSWLSCSWCKYLGQSN